MKKTLLVVLAVVALVASLGFATVASASATESPVKAARGVGSLSAQGDGIAILGGRGQVELSGNGVLWVKDIAGNATIEVNGYGEKEEFPDGWIQYSGYDGNAYIEGKLIVVIVAGTDINLSAEGHGRAILWGHGTLTKNGQTEEWGKGPSAQRPASHLFF